MLLARLAKEEGDLVVACRTAGATSAESARARERRCTTTINVHLSLLFPCTLLLARFPLLLKLDRDPLFEREEHPFKSLCLQATVVSGAHGIAYRRKRTVIQCTCAGSRYRMSCRTVCGEMRK